MCLDCVFMELWDMGGGLWGFFNMDTVCTLRSGNKTEVGG